MSPQPGDPAPWFGAKCYHTDRYVDLSLADLNGSWVLLFFYPLDFGHISPAELLELERVRPALERLGCQVVAVSRDSALVHEQFTSLAPTQGGVAGIRFPLAEDPAGDISRAFGMLMPDSQSSITFRGCFILDPSGIVKGRLTSDLPVGIDIEELVHQVTKLAASEATFTEEDSVTLEHPVEEKLLAVGSSDPATFYTNCILRSREYPKYSQVFFSKKMLDKMLYSFQQLSFHFPLFFVQLGSTTTLLVLIQLTSNKRSELASFSAKK